MNQVSASPQVTQVLNTNYQADKVREINGAKNQYKEQSFPRSTTSKDSAAAHVSEKYQSNNLDPKDDFRLLNNTPIAQLLESIKPFNETIKSNRKIDYSTRAFDETIAEDKEETIDDSKPIGYYLVINEKKESTKVLMLKAKVELWRDRIEKTYHTKVRKENGALVNLTI